MIGKQISHYRITELIATGGMGAVYKADDLKLNRTVAVKVVKPANIDPTLSSKRFLREARAVSKINHPNVVTLLGIEEQGASNYLIMEYVDGPSLRTLLSDGPVEAKRAVQIARDVARGLGAAHALGVIHRDIKPENVVLDGEGRARVLDFGVAHLVDQTTMTRKGRIIGTLPYMSPEQIQAKPVDVRSDTYALGVLLYEMLTGKLPFDAREEEALFFQILNLAPPPLEDTITGLPAGLQDILATALAKDPDERYQSTADMVHDIEVILARMGTGRKSDKLVAHPRRRWKRRLFGALLGLFVLAVMLVSVIRPDWFQLGAGDAGKQRIIIMKAVNASGQEDLEYLSGAIMDCLISSLGRLEDYNVVSRETVSAAMDLLELDQAGLVPANLIGAAKEVGADFLVAENFTRMGSSIRINCELTDIDRGILVESWSETIHDLENEFFPVIDRFAEGIGASLGADWKPDRTDEREVALTESMEAMKFYQSGLEKYELGDVPATVRFMWEAVGVDSVFPAAYLYLSRLDPNAAAKKRALDSAMKYRHRAPPPLKDVIVAAFHRENAETDEAIRTYERVLGEYPEEVFARSAMAELLIQKRRFGEAVAEYAVLRTVSPFDFSFYPNWWVSYFEIGRVDKALNILTDWRSRFPAERAPLRELVRINNVMGRYAACESYLDTLATIERGGDLSFRGYLLIVLGQLDAAERVFNSLRELPDRFFAGDRDLTYLAFLHYRRGDCQRGYDFIEKAMTTQNDYYNHWTAGVLASCNNDPGAAGRHTEAIAREFRISEQDTTVVEAFALRRFYYNLSGVIALEAGELDRAIRLFEASLRFSQRVDRPFFGTYLGNAYLAAGRNQEALGTFESVFEVNPDYPLALLGAAKAQVELGARDRAREVLKRLDALWDEADRDFPPNKEFIQLVESMGE